MNSFGTHSNNDNNNNESSMTCRTTMTVLNRPQQTYHASANIMFFAIEGMNMAITSKGYDILLYIVKSFHL